MRIIAFVWLIFVLVTGGYLFARIYHGLNFHTDLMALLPREEQNPELQRANDTVTRSLSRHIVILVGHKDRIAAREAASKILQQLSLSGLLDINSNEFDKNRLREIGKFYYPYRTTLLSDEDRDRLKAGKEQEIATRALSQVYGVMGLVNAKLLHDDPFLLMPNFLANLPIPMSRLSLDDGMLSLSDSGMTWVLITAQLKGEPFALDVQKQISDVYDQAVKTTRTSYSDLQVLHLGAVFFAKAGAEEAMSETSTIGIVSTLGAILLVIVMFRAVRPLLFNLLVIGVGVMTALSASLWIFGELHVGALLFGISLIGVAVDYGLQYCSEIFVNNPGSPQQRLKRVLIGITLGASTTVIGYLTLLLAPFPGLHQIAVFSAIGLIAAWLTVVLWLPLLDKNSYHPQPMLSITTRFLAFWEDAQYSHLRLSLFVILAIMGFAGFLRFHVDDDVRRMQSLSPQLVSEQERIQKLTGATTGSQFFLVVAPNSEMILQREEELVDRLRPLVVSGALSGFQSPSQYIPSAARQAENHTLQRENLYKPLLIQQKAALNLQEAPFIPDEHGAVLTLAEAQKTNGPLKSIATLILDNNESEVTHIVSLDGVVNLASLKAAAEGIPGVRFVDPAGDYSALLGKYRSRAIELLALSALFMAPLLVWRYGWRKGLWVMVPPLLAVILAPALRALVGGTFTFFDAMALVLVLSIGVDYAVFCAETSRDRKPVTMLAVAMAASTAVMSFGLLALSRVLAVHNFGATMLVGILLSFVFAPMVRLVNKNTALKMRNIACIVFVLALCSCADQPAGTVSNSAVHISPDLTVVLPAPATLGRTVEADQLVITHYDNKSFAFNARVSATPEYFRMVCLDMMGRKMISINWTKDGIDYDASSWVPPQLRPENILADMILLYWPDAAVRQALMASSGKLVAHHNSRTIMFKNKPIFQASYRSTHNNDPWLGKLHYRNLAWGYEFDVQSVEVMP